MLTVNRVCRIRVANRERLRGRDKNFAVAFATNVRRVNEVQKCLLSPTLLLKSLLVSPNWCCCRCKESAVGAAAAAGAVNNLICGLQRLTQALALTLSNQLSSENCEENFKLSGGL